ncbi:UMP kinase [archaeon]|nr:MAG: UMP kinase [archaeon]
MVNNFSYRRALIKISGDTFGTPRDINISLLQQLVHEISAIQPHVELSFMIGGGNLFRGRDPIPGIAPIVIDKIGMISTLINALIFEHLLEQHNIPTVIMSALPVAQLAEGYVRERAIQYLESKYVVLFAMGLGSPFFTTDTAAVLRAAELHADVMIKGSKVDGVYDSDPNENPHARMFTELTFDEALHRNLRVMDRTAFALAAEQKIPIIVLNIMKSGNLTRALQGDKVGTLLHR